MSFDVPYPPNYGGVIDVFYKLKKLSELGIAIHLHCFEYGRGKQKELLKYCKTVHYYQRNTSFQKLVSLRPYIVKTRNSNQLLSNLLKDEHPILFEGLHTTAPLLHHDFGSRTILVRPHNIEHNYYRGLSKSETGKRKKLFFKTEAQKLKKYEAILHKAGHILSISPFEHDYFKNKYGNKTIYTPVFYNEQKKPLLEPDKKFALWHGDLKVVDNQKAALFVIEVFSDIPQYDLVIASNTKNATILKEIAKHKNIRFDNLAKEGDLDKLFQSAHLHPLVTYQKTGIKLKLLNTLTNGKYVVANTLMTEDTGLEELCLRANTVNQFHKTISKLMELDFTEEQRTEREKVLSNFNGTVSAQTIIDLL